MNNQIIKGVNSYSCQKNTQGSVSTRYVMKFLVLAFGLLHACKDSPSTPAAPPSFSDMFFKTYRSFAPMRVVPKGIPLDSVSFPLIAPASSELILRQDSTYSMKVKFSIAVRRGSGIDTLTYKIDEQGELQVKSANHYYGEGGIGWLGNVKFTPAKGMAWECQYDLEDLTPIPWALVLWGPIWLPDSSYVTAFKAFQ